MSICIRPVVETWGESFAYSSRETHISQILEAIAESADKDFTTETHNYGEDICVFFAAEGGAFLDYLENTGIGVIEDYLVDQGTLSVDEEERARQLQDILGICAMAAEWRKSLDPRTGSLRIYCD